MHRPGRVEADVRVNRDYAAVAASTYAVRSGLFAGGKRIRTIGPARRKAVVPKREHPRAASRSLPGRPQTISARTTVRQPAIRS